MRSHLAMTQDQPWQSRRAKLEPDKGILDLDHLRRYTLDDPALERELLGLFLSQAETTKGQLAGAANADDWKLAAHSLKGSALAVGAAAIATLSSRIEDGGFVAGEARNTIVTELDRAILAFRVAARSIGC
jgi:HPt (histidine-containing phosphotransfer) domain-containing protein